MAKTSPDPFDDFVEARKTGRDRCLIGDVLGALDDRHRQALEKAFALPRKDQSSPSIVKVLNKWGHKVSHHTVDRHRNGACCCER